jgi:glycosyltransferase involved in cell wall biosynthesis
MNAPVSVLILTYNEEANLPGCLASVAELSDDVHVVDSFSTDRTVEIARQYGAGVVQHEFAYPAQQKNWALDNMRFKHEWLLVLDADERVPQDLRAEIAQVVQTDGDGKDGFWMRYRLIFYGKWIRHCGWYPTWILRLVRRGKVRWEDRPVDEHAIVSGALGRLQHDIIHESQRDMHFWIAKHNGYSTHNARIFAVEAQRSADGLKPRLWGNQAERKRFIKQRIWPHLPGRALLFFLHMYFIRLGFLDGVHGFHFCVMHAIFQQFVVVKQWEQERHILPGREAAIQTFKNPAPPLEHPGYEKNKLIS